ncbi:hypothetical protein CR513_05208, partial [Mucuna pruriens]
MFRDMQSYYNINHTKPTSYYKFSHLQLVKFFERIVYVSIVPPRHTKMSFQVRLRIYVGYKSPSIIKYLESPRDDLFMTWFVDCQFF